MITIPVVCGPTAVGKTEIVNRLAIEFNLIVVSADSRQIYRYMDIGTAKPDRDTRRVIDYRMLDIVNPDEIFSAGEFGRMARIEILKSIATGRKVIVCGGSGLYIRSIFTPLADLPPRDDELRRKLEEYPTGYLYRILKDKDPEYARRIAPNDRQRIVRGIEVIMKTGERISSKLYFHSSVLKPIYFVLTLPYDELYRRIERRFDRMVEDGFLDEVKKLKEMGYDKNLYPFNAMGYRELFLYLEGWMDYSTARHISIRKIKNFARKQMIWFRKMGHIFLKPDRKTLNLLREVVSSI